jgi:tetratricopeptide (TPR) repeat protein
MIDSAIKWFGEAKGVEHTEDALKREIKNDELIRKVRDIRVQNRFGQINEVFDEVMSSGIAEAKDNLAVALYNGGTDSVDLAEVKEDDKTVELLKEACENYARALKLKPDYLEALNNWGTALSKLAARTAGQEAEELFAQSFEKYERALKLKPDYPEALINWGTALSKLAKRKEGKKAEELFAQSFEKYMKAEKFKEGTAAYDIACNYALRGEVNKALNWLEKGLKMELLPSRRHVITDRDLDKIKGREAFKRILSKYRPE